MYRIGVQNESVGHAFRINGDMVSYEEIKVGIVNQTYKVNYVMEDGKDKPYIVQSINTYAFKQPELIMDNIDQITEHMRPKKVGKVALHFHHTEDGKTYYIDEKGFWRLFNYIESDTYNVTADLEVVRNAGEAFGEFQMLLADYDAANYVEEDCPNLEFVGVNLDVYSTFAEGFLNQNAKSLTKEEIETLPLSCFAITVELATRFLADYIAGDPYFHINYPEHNLVRARNQIALAKDMLVKMDAMERVVKECVEKYA